MNYVTFLPARGVGTAVPEPSWKASAGLEAHAANKSGGSYDQQPSPKPTSNLKPQTSNLKPQTSNY